MTILYKLVMLRQRSNPDQQVHSTVYYLSWLLHDYPTCIPSIFASMNPVKATYSTIECFAAVPSPLHNYTVKFSALHVHDAYFQQFSDVQTLHA